MAIDKDKFIINFVSGMTATDAYVEAGGKRSEHSKKAAYSYRNRPEIRKLINITIQDRVLTGLITLPELTKEAVMRISTLIKSPDEKIALSACKVALDKARDFLPKEVSITHDHNHSLGGEDGKDEALKQLADLIKQDSEGGSRPASIILEAVREEQSRATRQSDDESGESTGEHVYSVQTK